MQAMFRLLRNRRGVIGVFTAVSLPITLGISALVVDAGLWTVTQTRLQYAADAAASATGYLLTNASVKAQGTSATLPTFQAVALAAVNDATGMRLIGTLATPVSVKVASDYSSVTVTLTSQAPSYFAGAVGFQSSPLTATATAGLAPPVACILALSASTSRAIEVDNNASIKATNCGVYSNSSANDAIYLTGGATISGTSVGAHGGVSATNGSSVTPSPTTYGGVVSDPFATMTAPTPGSTCDYTNGNWTNNGTYSFNPGVYCGTTQFGGNNSTNSFAPGIYYIKNGDLLFNNNSTTKQASGVTFVLTGTNVGKLSWANNSSTTVTFTAPTSGPTAGFVVWQTCPPSNTTLINQIDNNSALKMSGVLYMPCGDLQVLNNAQFAAPANGALTIVANRILASSNVSIQAASVSVSGGANAVALKP